MRRFMSKKPAISGIIRVIHGQQSAAIQKIDYGWKLMGPSRQSYCQRSVWLTGLQAWQHSKGRLLALVSPLIARK
jgi:hypothetical protein